MDDIYRNATLLAQTVERESMDRLDLSIQELIDCDTSVDQGCVGGNPLLAYSFVHTYGLTSSYQYPYVGAKGKCHTLSANNPIATVESWGILPPNSERHMELAVRYIGPIAVSFNGGDPTFLSYSGGIYYNKNCHHHSNHALLIVGYGEEERTDDNGNNVKIPYWIARNSVS
jgi:C1A family cysteine protease